MLDDSEFRMPSMTRSAIKPNLYLSLVHISTIESEKVSLSRGNLFSFKKSRDQLHIILHFLPSFIPSKIERMLQILWGNEKYPNVQLESLLILPSKGEKVWESEGKL